MLRAFHGNGSAPVSIETHKATAHDFFARLSASDLPGAWGLMTDDATWWIAGDPQRHAAAGLYSKDKIARLLDHMLRRLDSGLHMTVLSTIAEADRVALEVESRGTLRNGRRYQQAYHFLLVFRDGRISAVKEYLDTQHAYDVWIAPATDAEQAALPGR